MMENDKKDVNPYVIAAIIILPTFWAMVATSGANVCLPYIAGYYGATQNEAKTVLTSYMIANAILIPMTGGLMKRLGTVKLLNLCIIIFTLGSLICTFSPNLLTLIIGRVVQGIGGGALMPLAQAVLLDTFPYEQRGTAMGLFGLAVIMPPLIGPYIGGYLTDNFSWQWSFFINIPFCVLALILNKMFLPATEVIREKYRKKFDIIGLTLLVLCFFSMQIVLDKGQQYNWFDNEWIVLGAFVAVFSLVAFYVWELEYKYPLLNIRVFKNRNFLVGTIIGGMVSVSVYGTLFLIPMFVQGMLGYSATLSGLVTLPRMLTSFFGLIIVGKIADYIDNRILLAIGVVVLSLCSAMYMNYNLNFSPLAIALPNYFFGLGIALVFIPLSTLAFSTLAPRKIPDGAALHSLVKCICNACAIAYASTFIARHSQINQTYLLDNLTNYNIIFQNKVATLKMLALSRLPEFLAGKKAYGAIYGSLLEQATLQSFFQAFLAFVAFTLCMLPLIFLFKVRKS